MFRPPREAVVDLAAYEISPTRGFDTQSTIESDDGRQTVPVTIYLPERNGRPNLRHPAGHVALRAYAWSASNGPNYQRARTQAYADIIGMPVIAPNNIGQGEGSPDLTSKQKAELKAGRTEGVAGVMLRAAVEAYEAEYGPISNMVFFGDSLAPSLAPGIIGNLPDHINMSHQIWMAPDGTYPGRSRAKVGLQEIRELPFLFIYREFNPAEFRAKGVKEDTNLLKALCAQWSGHMTYPYLITHGELVGDTNQACRDRDVAPITHILSGTRDHLSPHSANLAAAHYLDYRLDARVHKLEGHTHCMIEYVGLMGLKLAEALGVEVETVAPESD